MQLKMKVAMFDTIAGEVKAIMIACDNYNWFHVPCLQLTPTDKVVTIAL